MNIVNPIYIYGLRTAVHTYYLLKACAILASSPGLRGGGERKAWYTLHAHALRTSYRKESVKVQVKGGCAQIGSRKRYPDVQRKQCAHMALNLAHARVLYTYIKDRTAVLWLP